RSRIENNDLSYLHFLGGILSDAHFFLTVKVFLLAQRGIFESPFPYGKCAAVRAVDEAVGMEDFEVLANRDLRGFESAGEFGDENATLTGKQIEDGAAAFFVQHEISLLAA